MYLPVFVGLSLLGVTFSEHVSVEIVKNKIMNYVSDKYLSFSVSPNLFKGEDDTFKSECLCMEKFLYPSYMKITVPSPLPEKIHPNTTLGDALIIDQLKNLLGWMKRSRFTPFIVVENEASGYWSPETVVKVMAEAEKFGLEEYVWQLGEGCLKQSPGQYLNTLKTFKLMMEVFKADRGEQWRLASGDLNSCLDQGNTDLFFAKGILDALTFDPTHDFETMDFIDETNKEPVKAHLKDQGIQLWKTVEETKGVEVQDKAIDWLRTLGETARNGYSVLFKEMEKNELKIPTMSYYVSLLHKILVGQQVLDVSQGSAQVPVYGHCAKLPSGPLSGAVTLLAANSGQMPANLHVQISNNDGGEIVQFILQENTDQDIIINGKQKLDEEYLVPLVKEMKPFDTLYISLPPKSVGFWVITNTDVQACYFDEGSTEIDEHIFVAKRVKRHIKDEEINLVPTDKTIAETVPEVFVRNLPVITDQDEQVDQLPPLLDNPFWGVAFPSDQSDTGLKDNHEESITAGQLTETDETVGKRTGDLMKKDDFVESLIFSKNIDFEPVNIVTENIDIEKHFVDVPARMGLKDLEADEMQTPACVRSNEMNNMEDLVTLISQLSSLMELQEEFLGVESAILQPLSSVWKVSDVVRDGVDSLKRTTRGQAGHNSVDGLIVFKHVELREKEELTSDRIKDLFFGEGLNSKIISKIVRDPKANLAMVSIDLNDSPFVQSDLPEQPSHTMDDSETVTESEKTNEYSADLTIGAQLENSSLIPTSKLQKISDLDLSKLTPNLSKISESEIAQSLPSLDDLVGRAKNLLKEVNPNDEDNSVQESRTAEEVVGTPLGILPLGVAHNNLKLTANLAKTRVKMQELRHKVQSRLAQLKVKTLMNADLQKHMLVKRSLKDENIEIIKKKTDKQNTSLKKNKTMTKNKRKKFFGVKGKLPKKQFTEKTLTRNKETTVDLTKPGIDLTLSNNRVRRFIATKDDFDKNNISDELDAEDHQDHENDAENEIIDDYFRKNKIKITPGNKSSSEKFALNSENVTAVVEPSLENKNTPQDSQNELDNTSFELKIAKIAKLLDNQIHKLISEDASKENQCGAAKLESKAGGSRKEKSPSAEERKSEENILDSVIDRISSVFEGIYGRVKDLYGKTGNR